MQDIAENQEPTTEETGERYDYPLFREAVMNGFAGAQGAPMPGQPANAGGGASEAGAAPREQSEAVNPAPPDLRMVDVGLQKAVMDAVTSVPKPAAAVLANQIASAGAQDMQKRLNIDPNQSYAQLTPQERQRLESDQAAHVRNMVKKDMPNLQAQARVDQAAWQKRQAEKAKTKTFAPRRH